MKKCLGAIFLLCSLVAWAIPVNEVPNPRERDGSWVSDTAGILSLDQIRSINQRIDQLQAINGSEIAVVTVPDTTPLKPKAYATQLFNLWGVGDSQDNSGVLILVVMDQRRIEFEVGTGANRYLTDAQCSNILQGQVIPFFKQGKPGVGVVQAVIACAEQLEPVDYSAAPPQPLAQPAARPVRAPRPVATSYSPPSTPPYAIYVGAMVVAIILFLVIRQYLRNKPRRCPGCRLEMMRLGEAEDDEFLSAGQIDEEGLGSVDYDVWVCRACDQQKVVAYGAWFSSFRRCGSCSFRCEECTNDVVTSQPTYYSSGSGRRDYYCRHCGRRRYETYTIPQKTQSNTSSSSSSFSSSSSSSFGGGSSSGGGAGASW